MIITVKNFQKKIPVNPKRIKRIVLKVLSSKRIKKSGELTISFVSDARIKGLNLRYLHKNIPTDVLVFDLSQTDKPAYAYTDIIISTDTAIRNSKVFGTTPLYELYLYIVHGLLHTLGYDDKTKKQRQIMDKKANKICQYIKPKP